MIPIEYTDPSFSNSTIPSELAVISFTSVGDTPAGSDIIWNAVELVNDASITIPCVPHTHNPSVLSTNACTLSWKSPPIVPSNKSPVYVYPLAGVTAVGKPKSVVPSALSSSPKTVSPPSSVRPIAPWNTACTIFTPYPNPFWSSMPKDGHSSVSKIPSLSSSRSS